MVGESQHNLNSVRRRSDDVLFLCCSSCFRLLYRLVVNVHGQTTQAVIAIYVRDRSEIHDVALKCVHSLYILHTLHSTRPAYNTAGNLVKKWWYSTIAQVKC